MTIGFLVLCFIALMLVKSLYKSMFLVRLCINTFVGALVMAALLYKLMPPDPGRSWSENVMILWWVLIAMFVMAAELLFRIARA